MKKSNWKVYAFWIVLLEAVGALSGWLTRKGVKTYNATIQQPTLSPPSIVFPIVWGILFVLMGIGAAHLSGSGVQCSVTQPVAVPYTAGVQFLLEHYLL